MKLPSRMVSHPFQEKVPSSDLDDRGQVSAISHRNSEIGDFHLENRIGFIIDPQPLVFLAGVPLEELDDEIDDFFSLMADIPNRSLILIIPSPRTSMRNCRDSAAPPTSAAGLFFLICTTSSATRR